MNLYKFYLNNPSLLQAKIGNTAGDTAEILNGAVVGTTTGTWSYASGINGTVVVPAATRVAGISAYAALGGTITVNGGMPITLPIGVAISIAPSANLIAPTIVFTGTSTYFVELVS